MSELFQRSKAAWQQVAADMGATYILWSADEIDTMVREHYPQIWDMYTTVRYPIMRADIGRVAILHRYGGLYSDLDVFPNRSEFEQAWLAVCIQPSNVAKNPHFLEM
jgi:mannosyltransferase OCH1-like enzyme